MASSASHDTGDYCGWGQQPGCCGLRGTGDDAGQFDDEYMAKAKPKGRGKSKPKSKAKGRTKSKPKTKPIGTKLAAIKAISSLPCKKSVMFTTGDRKKYRITRKC